MNLFKSVSNVSNSNAGADPNLLEIMPATVLLKDMQSDISSLKEHVGVGAAAWKQYYWALLVNYAEFVQGLPASASHHHSGEVGLLRHSLEVAIRALNICDSQLIPQNSGSGYHDASKDLLLYATFSAALLHDIGKVLTDQKITLFSQKNEHLGAWLPLSGAMRQVSHARYYSVDYLEQRVYRLHQMAALSLAPLIMPIAGLSWIANLQSPTLFYSWLYALSGDLSSAGHLGKAIQSADAQSVAANLGGNEGSVSIAAALPLHDQLLTSLQTALRNNEIKINAPGAMCFVYEKRAYFVVKALLDFLRTYLATRGVSAVPTDNNRLMDVLLEQKILVPNPSTAKAVWRVEVQLEQNPTWSQSFTTVVLDEQLAFKGEYGGRTLQGNITIKQSDPSDAESSPDRLEPNLSLPANHLENVEHEGLPSTETPHENFIEWFVSGINEGLLTPNGRGSKVHILDNNRMFIVSPAIFKAFDTSNWTATQKLFEKIGLVDLPKGESTSLFKAILKPAGYTLTGYVLSNPQTKLKGLKVTLPDANPNLFLIEGGAVSGVDNA